MDLATVLGILAGLILVVITIISGGDAGIFIHGPSFMVVIGGAIAATLISFQLKEVIGVMGVVRKAFFSEKYNFVGLIEQIVDLSKKARRDGLLAIDREVNQLDDEFLR